MIPPFFVHFHAWPIFFSSPQFTNTYLVDLGDSLAGDDWIAIAWERGGIGGACHQCIAVKCEREATLTSGEENELGEGAVMAVKRFFGQIWWCGGLGCCFCGGWRRKEKKWWCAAEIKMDEGEYVFCKQKWRQQRWWLCPIDDRETVKICRIGCMKFHFRKCQTYHRNTSTSHQAQE